MSALAVKRLPVVAEPPQPRLFALPGGAEAAPAPAATVVTLEGALTSAWSALGRGLITSCVVCGGEMAPRWSAGSGCVGGRCTSCGSTLE